MISDVKKFYLPYMEHDPNVRYMWYILWYYFLPKVNPNWKSFLKVNTIKKKELIYDYITTSDEAVTLWFLDLLLPKVQEQHAKNWPVVPKSSGEGDQESRTKKKEYSIIYKKIHDSKKLNQGELACCWSNVFWEELTVRHPSMFKSEVSNKKNLNTSNEENEEEIFLPDIDEEDNDLKLYFNIRQTSHQKSEYSLIAPSSELNTTIEDTFIAREENHINSVPNYSTINPTNSSDDVIYNDQNQLKENLKDTPTQDNNLKDNQESNTASVTIHGQEIKPVSV